MAGKLIHHRLTPGIPFPGGWPEWKVECGEPTCDEQAMLVSPGVALTSKEAEQIVRELGFEAGGEGWLKVKGRWYCPAHLEGARQREGSTP